MPGTQDDPDAGSVDLVLTAAFVLPCDGRGLISEGLIAIRGGRIVSVGPQAVLQRVAAGAAEQLDFGPTVILPGLVNAHTHLEFTPAGPVRPAVDGRGFANWIADLVAWSRSTSPADRLASARAGAAAMLRAGITCIGDIVSRGQGAQAMVEAGLHGTAFCEFVGGYPEGPTQDLTSRLVHLRDRVDRAVSVVKQANGGIRIGISPHAPYTVSADALQVVSRLARKQGLPLACHLAESGAELEFLADGTGDLAEFMGTILGLAGPLRPAARGADPLSYASAGGLLPASGSGEQRADVLLVHGAHLGPRDVVRLSGTGVALALCPRSNKFLSVGAQAPVAHLARAQIPLSVGTDSLASNTDVDLFEELRALRDMWAHQQPDADTYQVAHRLLRMATIEGATALGLDVELGTVTARKRADLAVLDLPSAGYEDSNDPTSGLVRAIVDELDASAVIATFTDGRCRYQRGTVAGSRTDVTVTAAPPGRDAIMPAARGD